MPPGIVEYVVLRLARRFLFTDWMLRRVGRIVPYYRENANEVDPAPVVRTYVSCLERGGRALPPSPTILEVGSGATNSVGYALASHPLAGPAGRVVLFEPYAPLDAAADARQRARHAPRDLERVRRVTDLAQVPDASIDLVVSSSVLEHVRDPRATFAALRRVLAPGGFMLHAVDYRDHFFKYPYHFLLFAQRTWDRWLDPGDLPRWRLGDHLKAFAAEGFAARVLDSETLATEFARVAADVDPGFDRSEPHFAVARASLVVERAR